MGAILIIFHKRRIKMGINMKIIYNSDTKEYGKIREHMKLSEVRYFENLISPNWIDIFSEAIMLTVMIEGEPISFVVRNNELADSFRSYFDMLWNISVD